MKTAFALLFSLFLLTSCQKFIETQAGNAALAIVTTGKWKVTSFKKGTEDKTPLFSNYTFQFLPNETVDAIKNGAVEINGTWKVDITARTITSAFSTSAEPLILLNGIYTVTDSSPTTVDAKQTVNGEIWVLHLDKI